MKKLLSLILAITMIASIAALSVSAAEVKAGNTTGNISVKDGVYDAVEDNGSMGYAVLGESDNWEVTMTLTNTIDNPEYGLYICGKDQDGDGNLSEGADSFLQIFFHGAFGIRWHGCDFGWGNIPGYGWTDEHLISTGKGGKITMNVKVKLSGKNLEFFVEGEKVGDTVVLEDKVMFGNVVSLEVKHPGNPISNVVFTDLNKKTDDKKDDVKPSTDKVNVVTKTVAGATDGNASWEGNSSEFTVTKKYFAVSYTMTAALKAGIAADNGCCGLTFSDGDPETDDSAIYLPYDGTDGTSRILGCWWDDTNHPYVRFGPWWGSNPAFGAEASLAISELTDKEVTILVLGQMNGDGTATVTAYVNGTQVKVWGNQDEATGAFDGNIGWSVKLNNTEATLHFAERDEKPFDKTVFDNIGNDDQGNTDTPVTPKTGDATAIVALVSVLALAGAVVASKKRA